MEDQNLQVRARVNHHVDANIGHVSAKTDVKFLEIKNNYLEES